MRLRQVARLFELEKNKAAAEVLQLRRKLADITNSGSGSDCEDTPSKRSRTDPDNNNDEETKVINSGHLFVMLHSLWLRHGEGTFDVEYNPEWDDAERFENADNKVQGQLQEIKVLLGSQLFGELSSEAWIAKAVSQLHVINLCKSDYYNHQFIKGMKAQRSNTATRLRRHCAALFGVSESDMFKAEIRKEKFRDRIGWVDNGRGVGSYSSVDVEILHKHYSGSYDMKTAFLNPILMWVSNLFIYFTSCWNILNYQLINCFSGLRCYHTWSNRSQGVDEWDRINHENRNHGSKAWHSTHHTRGYSRQCNIGMRYTLTYFCLETLFTSLISLAGPFPLTIFYKRWARIPASIMRMTMKNTLKFS
jgi:hypothetical protein